MTEVARGGRGERSTSLVIALTALFAGLAAVALAIVALNKKPAAQKANLQPLAALTSEARTLKAEVATLHALVAKSDATVARMTTCLPELSGQINNLSVETNTLTVGERTLLTGAYLKAGKQVSTYCQSTLESSGAVR